MNEPQQARRVIEFLSTLSYRSGELKPYLHEIAVSVSRLLGVDWSVVTYCQDGHERILASSIDIGEAADRTYDLHGLLTGTVVDSGRSLVVRDSLSECRYGVAPEGYRAYLGVPLRTPGENVIGTICSFHRQPRRFSEQEVQVAELFAERAATAIDNYQLFQQQQAFNEALEAEVQRRTQQLKTAQEKIVEQERLAAIGEFAASIVHEIRNPLTTVKMALDFCDRRLELAPDAARRLQLAGEEADRLENLLAEILLYAKPHVLNCEEIELDRWLGSLMVSLREMPSAAGRQLDYRPSSTTALVRGDRDKLKQIAVNLVGNACEAVAVGETVTCAIEVSPEQQQVVWSIHNGGQPIPPEILPKLTQPFVTTKSYGTGLGLAIVSRIARAHEGRLSISSSEGQGTTVAIVLPLATPG